MVSLGGGSFYPLLPTPAPPTKYVKLPSVHVKTASILKRCLK